MFITSKYAGYNRRGDQCAAGYFLILMQPTTDSQMFPAYQNACMKCGKPRAEHKEPQPIHSCPFHGIIARLKARIKAQQEPTDTDFLDGYEYCSQCHSEHIFANVATQERECIDCHHTWPGCSDCKRYSAELQAQGCVNFIPKSNSYKIRALVRYVRMRQLGHFMMGSARILNTSITLSGSYGSDGLPKSVPDEVYELGTELPQELYDAWNTGGGWNGAGREANAMRDWARKTFPKTK